MNETGFNFQLKESHTICCPLSPQQIPCAFFFLPVEKLYNSPILPVQ